MRRVRESESMKNVTYSLEYLKSRNERINAFVMRCNAAGFTDLHAYMSRDFPTGSRERPVIFMDATAKLLLASWWDDESGEFCLRASKTFLRRERILAGQLI
jgi:hypothetical protein